MARFQEPTPADLARWADFLSKLNPHVRAVAEKFDPWSLYRMTDTDHRVQIYSVDEHGADPVTLTVVVLGRWNRVKFERRVFGIKPDELVPCELPGPDEELGVEMTQEEAEDRIDELRVHVRPDLWYLDENGKAVRKQ